MLVIGGTIKMNEKIINMGSKKWTSSYFIQETQQITNNKPITSVYIGNNGAQQGNWF